MAFLAEAVTDNPAAVAVLKKHGLLTPEGSWRVTNVALEELGQGPILDPAVVEKFATLDTTRNFKVLDWMLLMAGGGTDALQKSAYCLDQTRQFWIRERVEGRGDSGEAITPMTQEQGETAWKQVEPMFRASLFPADQDTLNYYHNEVFGYVRNWPGVNDAYETVYKEVVRFIENVDPRYGAREGKQSKVSWINQAREKRAKQTQYQPVESDLSKYGSLEELTNVNDEFKYFFKRRSEVKNIEFIGKHPDKGYTKGKDLKLFEDDNVVVYLPATAAAMMQVGFDNWCVANKTEFETGFHHDPQQRKAPRWMEYQERGPIAVIHIKGEVPEPEFPKGHELHQRMKRVAVYLRRDTCKISELAPPYEGVQFFDRENRWSPHPVDWPELIGRLASVPGQAFTKQSPDGGPLIQSVKKAMEEIVAWAKQMKKGDIKISVYERLAAVLAWNLLYS